MTVEEGQKVIQQFEADGKSKEEIAGAFYLLFRDGKIDINGLEGLVNLLGYELDDDFKNMSTEDQKQYGYELMENEDDKVQDDEDEVQEEEQEQEQEPQKEPEENDEEKEEKEGLSYFEGRKSNQNDDDYDEEEEKEARKLLKY